MRAVKIVAARARRLRNRYLHWLETRPVPGGDEAPLAHPPILIIGAPRSGSTLLYQLVVERFDVGYLSNAHCASHGAPSRVEVRRRPLAQRGVSTFESHHGATEQPWEPSECGPYWYRFFPRRPHHVPADGLPRKQRVALRRSMWRLVAAFDRPVVFKNLYTTLRVGAVAAAVPEALFIVIRRDELANAHSLLAGRMQVFGSYEPWWSAEPPGFERLRSLPAEQQVVGQVRAMLATVDEERARIGGERFFDVSYERLCAAPREVLDEIAGWAAARGAPLAVRAQVPASFPDRRAVTIDPDLYARLEDHVGRAANAH